MGGCMVVRMERASSRWPSGEYNLPLIVMTFLTVSVATLAPSRPTSSP